MSKKTTTARRRSSRIKSKQIEKEEQEREEEEEVSEEAEQESEQEDYANKLRRRRGSPSNVEQDLSNLEGDADADYTDGDCVWAKYLDYPWWPGQIEISTTHSRRRKRAKRSTVTVRWFGDFPVKTNVCKLVNVIPWDPDDRDRIYVDVNEENDEAFQDSMDTANTVYLELCEERGNDPLQSALDYDEKNASRYAEQQQEPEEEEEEKEEETTTTSKRKRGRPKKKTTKKQTPKQSKRKKKTVNKKDEEVQNEPPELETIDDIDLNERQRTLRSAKKTKGTQSTVTTSQKKSVRRRGRKSSTDNEEDKAPKNKRGRKRKYDEAMNGDKEEEEEEEEEEDKGDDNEEDEDVDIVDLTEIEKEKDDEDEGKNKRRSTRVKAKNKENEDNLSDLYPESSLSEQLDSAWSMCEETHSAVDFTPWIALFYFGLRKYNKEGDKDGDVTNTVANIFHLEQDQVLNHLSEFTELTATEEKKTNPKKKRKKN